MQISKYAIINKIQLLAATIYDEDAAKDQKLYLHSTFSKLEMTSEFMAKNWVDKIDPEEYIPDVTVNLYQFFNIIDACTELIDLKVEDGKLIISSYYNEELETYEMTAELPTLEDFIQEVDKGNLLDVINCSQINLSIIKNEFHNYKSEGGFYIVSRGGHLKFYLSERGINSELIINEYTEYETEHDYTKFISFRLLELILGVGARLEDHKLQIYADYVSLVNKDIEITFKSPEDTEYVIPSIPGKSNCKQLFVFETDKFSSVLDLVKRLNKTNKYAKFVATSYPSIDESDEEIGELHIESSTEGTMAINTKVIMGISDAIHSKFELDPSIIFNILKTTGIKYVALYQDDNDNLILDYKNAIINKKLSYNHSVWMNS